MTYFNDIATRRINELIDSPGMNRNRLSKATGISYQTLGRKLESGGWTLEDLDKVAKALDMEPVDLLRDAA